MLEIETLSDLRPYVGKSIGTSDWVAIDQQRIDEFAREKPCAHRSHLPNLGPAPASQPFSLRWNEACIIGD